MRLLLTLSVALVSATGALAHHGWGSYDAAKPMTMDGVIAASTFENPHTSMTLTFEGSDWLVTLAPPSRMTTRGALAKIIQPGKAIKAHGYPKRDGAHEIRAEWIEVDGKRRAALTRVDALFLALQESPFAGTMRGSLFLYPLANVLHVLGALGFFAAAAAMDVNVLRAPDLGAARAFIRRVRPIAVAAFLVQFASGAMLLAPEALHVWHNPLFRVKAAAIVIGLINVAILELAMARGGGRGAPGGALRTSAAASLALWLGTAAAGRLIAYF